VDLFQLDDALSRVLQTLLALHDPFQFLLLHLTLFPRRFGFQCFVLVRLGFLTFNIVVGRAIVIGKPPLFRYELRLGVLVFATEEDFSTFC